MACLAKRFEVHILTDTMADLSVIMYVAHWFVIVVLCKKPLHYLIFWTFGIYFTTTAYLLTDDNHEPVTEFWSWFDYAKRISLYSGYLCYIVVYYYNNKASRILTQWLLTINVVDGSMLAFESGEIFVGVGLALITPFSPQLHVNNNNKTIYGMPGNLLQNDKYNYLNVKWYFRFHLIMIGSWYVTVLRVSFGTGSIP